MSALVSLPTSKERQAWPADLLEFTRARQWDGYLDPLLEMTRRLFPTGEIRVFLEADPELADVWFIVFEVRVPLADVPDFLDANRSWTRELCRLVPSRLGAPFILTLLRER